MNFFTPERIEKISPLVQDGKPFIFDDGDMRTLHFTAHVVQSAMRLSAPYELVISYTQAMGGLLSLHRAPEHILAVGLGGGSLVKYCYRNLPAARITALESNADVLTLRDQFMIPPDDARLQILHVDAVPYLAAMAAATADVILLDGFDANGSPQELCSGSFFTDCQRVLRDHGMLIVNMGDDSDNISAMVLHGRAVFGAPYLWWFKTATDNSHIMIAVHAGKEPGQGACDYPGLCASVLNAGERLGLQLVFPKPTPP